MFQDDPPIKSAIDTFKIKATDCILGRCKPNGGAEGVELWSISTPG